MAEKQANDDLIDEPTEEDVKIVEEEFDELEDDENFDDENEKEGLL